MIKFLKDIFTVEKDAQISDILLTMVLWLVLVIGGLFTLDDIGRYLMSINPSAGFIFGIGILVIGLGWFIWSFINMIVKDHKEMNK